MIQRYRVLYVGLSVALALTIAVPSVASAAQGEEPEYHTDTHGAAGVAWGFLELSDVAPEYSKYWQGALDWIVSVSKTDEPDRLICPLVPLAPPDSKFSKPSGTYMCHTVSMFFRAYEEHGDRKYRDAGLAGARGVAAIMQKRDTREGRVYLWHGALAGYSHGLAAFLEVFLAATQNSEDEEFEKALTGVLLNLRKRGEFIGSGVDRRFVWRKGKDGPIETGFCYGQAGIVQSLLHIAEVRPDIKLYDGMTPLSMANSNLRYLMDVAEKHGKATVWPYMRHSERSRNIGLGSGTGGIGLAFLMGARANREKAPEFAAECMKYARGAAESAVFRLLKLPQGRVFGPPGGDGGFGYCGGVLGSCDFLIRFAKEIGDSDPEFTVKIEAALRRVAQGVIGTAVEVDGCLACPDRRRQRIAITLDYGQTGVVCGLAQIGKYLKDDEILGAAKRVADFVAKHAVPEAGGYKFPKAVPFKVDGQE